MALVAGIDGCPSGWLCLTQDTNTGAIRARIFPDIAALTGLQPRPQVVLVDVPIGLPESGPRDCDREARARLRAPRASSVFPAPIRPMLAAVSYPDACHIGQQRDGRKLSRQAWGILPKISEVDHFLRTDPSRNRWLREVHPEVSFWAWNGCQAMAHNKKTAPGRAEREALVNGLYGQAYAQALSDLPRGQYGRDDLLDAFAALWSAERVSAGTALILPTPAPLDACGLSMEIVV